MLCGIRAVLPQGPFDLYNWGSLLLGTLPLPHAPWTLRFSILVGGSKHFFPALCKHQMQCLQYFWLLLSLALGSFLKHGLISTLLNTKGTSFTSVLSYFCRAHSSLAFSLRTSVHRGFRDLQLHLLNSGSFLSSGLGPPPSFPAWRISRQEDVEL